MKTYRIELVGFDWKEKHAPLLALAEDCQAMTNRIWQLWETHHVIEDSRSQIAAYLADAKAWHETPKSERGDKPKWPVDTFPKIKGKKNAKGNPQTLRNRIEADLGRTFPHVHSRVRTLVSNITCKKISDTKAAVGSLKGWAAILLNRQGRPSSTRPVPIPFDRANSKIIPGEKGENATLYVRLDRAGSRKVSDFEKFTLKTTGRASRYVKPIARMASGEWEYKGSSLYYDRRKRKWFALIVCEIAPGEKVQAVPGSVAVLRCGRHGPIQLRVNGRRRFLRNFGSGAYIAATRKQLLTQRWNRQSGYRVAGHANKGHGRERALGPVFLLSKRWKDFTKRVNHSLTAAVVQLCLNEGVGKVVYFQPSGGRFLDQAGKTGREDSTGWDYFQIKTLLAYKCEHHGIEFESRKSGVSESTETACA